MRLILAIVYLYTVYSSGCYLGLALAKSEKDIFVSALNLGFSFMWAIYGSFTLLIFFLSEYIHANKTTTVGNPGEKA